MALRPVHVRLPGRLKRSTKLFADETTAPALDPGRGCTNKGQLCARDERPWGRSRPPPRAFPHTHHGRRPKPLGSKPREGARAGRCRGLSYGDLAVGGPQLRSAARLVSGGDGVAARVQCDFLVSGRVHGPGYCVMNAALERALPWPIEKRREERMAFRGDGCRKRGIRGDIGKTLSKAKDHSMLAGRAGKRQAQATSACHERHAWGN
jgi:hypothetical protein